MKGINPIILILAIIGGVVVLGLVLKIALQLIGLAVVIGLGLIAYFAISNAQGKRP